MPTTVLISWLALLGEWAARGRDVSFASVSRFAQRLRLVKWRGELRASLSRDAVGECELDRRVAEAAAEEGFTIKVSARSLRHWRDNYNKLGADGLAVGPAALLDRYTTTPQRRPPSQKRKRGRPPKRR